jgi:hypothetical protein
MQNKQVKDTLHAYPTAQHSTIWQEALLRRSPGSVLDTRFVRLLEKTNRREGYLYVQTPHQHHDCAPLDESLSKMPTDSESESDIDATEFLDRDPLNEQSQPAVEAYGPSKQLASIRRLFTD